jgi:broad specificity phosphatase PhoE
MRAAVVLALALVFAAPVDAAIVIVRHAERVSQKDDASLISAAGKRRAEALRHVLSRLKLKAVFCTEYKRTQQTAAPAAKAHGLRPTIVSSENGEELASRLRKLGAEDDVLVVGHTDTIPDLLKALGVERPVAIEKEDYDNLFLVTAREGLAPDFAWLRYGAPSSRR